MLMKLCNIICNLFIHVHKKEYNTKYPDTGQCEEINKKLGKRFNWNWSDKLRDNIKKVDYEKKGL